MGTRRDSRTFSEIADSASSNIQQTSSDHMSKSSAERRGVSAGSESFPGTAVEGGVGKVSTCWESEQQAILFLYDVVNTS